MCAYFKKNNVSQNYPKLKGNSNDSDGVKTDPWSGIWESIGWMDR